MLSKLFSIIKEMTFNKSEFLANTPVLESRYKHFGSLNNNLFYYFNDQPDYTLVHYFAKLEIIKRNVD